MDSVGCLKQAGSAVAGLFEKRQGRGPVTVAGMLAGGRSERQALVGGLVSLGRDCCWEHIRQALDSTANMFPAAFTFRPHAW